jgi:hypothetical protein
MPLVVRYRVAGQRLTLRRHGRAFVVFEPSRCRAHFLTPAQARVLVQLARGAAVEEVETWGGAPSPDVRDALNAFVQFLRDNRLL